LAASILAFPEHQLNGKKQRRSSKQLDKDDQQAGYRQQANYERSLAQKIGFH
jgi:hypothetical protein